jgi:hypothetical protein
VNSQLRSRPFAPPIQAETTPQAELPDLQTQLENAQRFGHSFAKISASRPSIIQPKLTIGAPGDKYEQEADRVAQQVVQRINAPQLEQPQPAQAVQRETLPDENDELQRAPMLRRKAGEGAIAATTELESAIQQSRGSGQPLTESIRQPMEQAFNADFAEVRVHADARSDQLNRSIQAKAFTTGQDIFFRQDAYAPNSATGQELLAHELTHVVQQKGKPLQREQSTLHKAPAQIQRLVSEEDFKHLAGEASTKAKWDSSTYTKILKGLRDYAKATDETAKTGILNTLKKECEQWLSGHTNDVGGTAKPTENSDIRKASHIQGLLKEIQVALGEIPNAAATPSEIIGHFKQEQKLSLDAIDKQEKGASNAVRYQLTLHASIQNPYLIPFAQKRMQLTIDNEKNKLKKKFPGSKTPLKSGEEIKQEAAKQTLEEQESEKFKGMSIEERQAAIQKLASASAAVGHSWVKLKAFDAKDTQVKEHSFGFYPMQFYNRPELSVAGQVACPDTKHDKDPDQLALDYSLSQEQYKAALNQASNRLKSPPDYKLIDYNCTLFAKEVVTTAGQAFPGNAFMRVPTGAIAAFIGLEQGKAYNPNALYESLQAKGAYVPEAATAEEKKRQEEDRARELAAQASDQRDQLSEHPDEEFVLSKDVAGINGSPFFKQGTTIKIKSITNTVVQITASNVGEGWELYTVRLADLHSAIADQLNGGL